MAVLSLLTEGVFALVARRLSPWARPDVAAVPRPRPIRIDLPSDSQFPPKGIPMKTRKLLIALVAMFALFAAACGDDDTDTASSGDTGSTTAPTGDDGRRPAGRARHQDRRPGLRRVGHPRRDLRPGPRSPRLRGRSRSASAASATCSSPRIDNGEVNLSAEYAASMLEFLNDGAGEATGDADETVGAAPGPARRASASSHSTRHRPSTPTRSWSPARPPRPRATRRSPTSPPTAAASSSGAPQDCETNPFCLPGLQRVYGIDLTGGFTPLDSGLVADALAADAVQIGVLFSTSGRIADEGWVLLEDDKDMLAADNVTPVISDELQTAYGDDLATLLNEISAAIDTDTLTELNKRFDIDKEDAGGIAEDFIADAGL